MKRAEGTREAAAAVLGRWFGAHGGGSDAPMDHWLAEPVEDAWLFWSPGGRTNSANLVRGRHVLDFAPSEMTVEEALLTMKEPARRRDDGLDRPLLGSGITYPWTACGAVMAVPVIRDGRVGAYVFHGLNEESDAAGLIVREMVDAAGFGRYWFQELRKRFEAGVPPPEAVRSLLGHEGVRPDGDIGDELVRHDGGKCALDELLNPELVEQRRAGLRSGTSHIYGEA